MWSMWLYTYLNMRATCLWVSLVHLTMSVSDVLVTPTVCLIIVCFRCDLSSSAWFWWLSSLITCACCSMALVYCVQCGRQWDGQHDYNQQELVQVIRQDLEVVRELYCHKVVRGFRCLCVMVRTTLQCRLSCITCGSFTYLTWMLNFLIYPCVMMLLCVVYNCVATSVMITCSMLHMCWYMLM